MVETDELGPVDYLLVEFPRGQRAFDPALAIELSSLVDAELVRVLDLLVLDKHEDGAVEALEYEDLDDPGALLHLEGQLTDVLGVEDLECLAEAMEPGSTAGVIVWEHTWAAPFAATARRSGGRLVASGRIPGRCLLPALLAGTGTDDGLIDGPVERDEAVIDPATIDRCRQHEPNHHPRTPRPAGSA